MGIVLAGLSAATVLGVPVGIGIGAAFGWRAVFVLIAGLAFVQGVLVFWLPSAPLRPPVPFRSRLLVLRDPRVGRALSLYGVAGIFGSWWGGKLADRWGWYRALQLVLVLLVLCFVLLAVFSAMAVPAMAALVVWGLVGNAFTPIQQHRLLELAPTAGAGIIALNSSALYFGQTSAAVLGGLVLAGFGPAPIPLVSAGLSAAVLLVTLKK